MSRKLIKSTHDRKIAGVCGGLAEYFDIDSTTVRVAWILLSILSTGFPGLILYVILAFVMPDH